MRIIIALFLFFNAFIVSAQRPDTKREDFDFGDSYFLFVESNSVADFYVVNFAALTSDFERFHFKNQVFKSKIIVSIDAGYKRNVSWFQASKVFKKSDVENEFDLIYKKVKEDSARLTSQQKEDMMKKHVTTDKEKHVK